MRRVIAIIILSVALISCQRRELTYGYDPTVSIVVNTDWSNMDVAPTGMSIYCYPEDGGSAIVSQTNNTSSVTINLPAGVYNILLFNQIPSDYSYVEFTGMDSFETAAVTAVEMKSSTTVNEPDEVAAATYMGLEITDEDVRSRIELRSATDTKADIEPVATLSFTPKVVTKITRVRIRISAIYNHSSTSATLYGMATGYNFSEQKSHADMVTHQLDSWSVTEYDYNDGEVSTYFTSFGLPEQATSTRSTSQWDDWDGRMDITIMLVDNETAVNESITLSDKITTSTDDDDSKTDADLDANLDVSMDVNFDINIDSGFGDSDDDTSDDSPIVLPDVENVGSTGSGFDASIEDWGDKEDINIAI